MRGADDPVDAVALLNPGEAGALVNLKEEERKKKKKTFNGSLRGEKETYNKVAKSENLWLPDTRLPDGTFTHAKHVRTFIRVVIMGTCH